MSVDQSTENPTMFHTEQTFAALRTCDKPGGSVPEPPKWQQYRTLGVNGLRKKTSCWAIYGMPDDRLLVR